MNALKRALISVTVGASVIVAVPVATGLISGFKDTIQNKQRFSNYYGLKSGKCALEVESLQGAERKKVDDFKKCFESYRHKLEYNVEVANKITRESFALENLLRKEKCEKINSKKQQKLNEISNFIRQRIDEIKCRYEQEKAEISKKLDEANRTGNLNLQHILYNQLINLNDKYNSDLDSLVRDTKAKMADIDKKYSEKLKKASSSEKLVENVHNMSAVAVAGGGKGVCRDFANLLVMEGKKLGLPVYFLHCSNHAAAIFQAGGKWYVAEMTDALGEVTKESVCFAIPIQNYIDSGRMDKDINKLSVTVDGKDIPLTKFLSTHK